MLYMTRKYDFCASHRLYNPNFSDEKNQTVFRECNNPNGHGHNYELEVTIAGTPDAETGMVYDLWELDQLVQKELIAHVDHKHFNLDVPFMTDIIPTAENIVLAFWNQLLPVFESVEGVSLNKLRLLETKNNYAEITAR